MSLYKVDYIMGKRYNRTTKKNEYRVKWVGYDQNQATWEPENNLRFVKDLLQEYENKHRHRRAAKEEILLDNSGRQCNSENGSELIGESDFQEESGNSGEGHSTVKQGKSKVKRKRGRPKSKMIKKGRLIKKVIQSPPKKLQKLKEDEPFFSEESDEVNISAGSPSKDEKSVKDQIEQQREIPEIRDFSSDEDVELDPHFEILQLARKNTDLFYFIDDHGQKRWMTRKELIRTNPGALIDFYEKHIRFTPKREDKESDS